MLNLIYCISCKSTHLFVCFSFFSCTKNFTLRLASALITRLPITRLPFSWHLRTHNYIYLSIWNPWFLLKLHQKFSCYSCSFFVFVQYAGTPTTLHYFQKCTPHLHFCSRISCFAAFPLRGGRCWAGDQARTLHKKRFKTCNILLWETCHTRVETHHKICLCRFTG